MVQSFSQLASHPRVILMLPFTSFETDTNQISDNILVRDVIPRMQRAALEEGIEVLDMHSLLVDRPDLYLDNIHPGADVAGMIARRLSHRSTAGIRKGFAGERWFCD